MNISQPVPILSTPLAVDIRVLAAIDTVLTRQLPTDNLLNHQSVGLRTSLKHN